MGGSSDRSALQLADVDTRSAPSHGNRAGPTIPSRTAALLALAWAAFIVYGSLLPFDYVPQPHAVALERIRQIPLLAIGPGGRVDWMANLLLYVPLAFLSFAALSASPSRMLRPVRAALILVMLGVVATAIEFAQIFFPPRTVSLNDLVAEWLGILIGGGIWLFFGGRTRAAQLNFTRGGIAAAGALALLYTLIYVGLALFPFDFLLTPAEFWEKDFAKMAGWWLTPLACVRALQCETQLLAETLFAFPIGAAFVVARPLAARPTIFKIVFLGLLFGLAIELAQLLLGSGVSQGASVAAKSIGFIAGGLAAPHIAGVWRRLDRWSGLHLVLALLALAYLAALALALNLPHAIAIPWQDAVKRLADMPIIPFYNYYYTSETRALASLVFQVSLYLPPGVLVALATRGASNGIGQWLAGAASGMLALVVQVARLFHPPQRFDPTDVLIAIFAGVAAYHLTRALLQLADRTKPHHSDAASRPTIPPRLRGPGTGWLPLALVTIPIAFFVARFPVARLELAVGIVACWWLVMRRPDSWLVIVLALLPTLDLTQWSGRYYVDEFDAFTLASFVGGALLLHDAPRLRWPWWLTWLFGLFALSALISIARGLLPWAGPGSVDLAGYQSSFNALRVGRGLAWACLLLWLLNRTEAGPAQERSRFVMGMTLGLVGVGLIVLWERLVFVGPFNFHHEYRVAGTFSAISTAGAQIESYLAAATPFAMLLGLRARSATTRAIALGALALMGYAVASTASRTAYAGTAVAAVLMTLAWLNSKESMGRRLLIIFCVPVFAALAWMLVGGTFIAERMSHISRDLAHRASHWTLVTTLMDADLPTQVFGMGTGKYPATFLWRMPADRRPATFAFMREGDKGLLRLGAGHPLYVEQFVPVEHGQKYAVRGRLRAPSGERLVLDIALCDKWILYSLECAEATIVLHGSGAWMTFEQFFDGRDLARGPTFLKRPVKLILHNRGTTVVDVTDMRLDDAFAHNILANGDFEHDGDRWYFSGDEDPFPLNIFNLFVEILFEQGWFGLTTFIGLLAVVVSCLLVRAWQGNLLAAAFLAALSGYLVPALFDSIIDDPRMRMLLIMMLCGSIPLTQQDDVKTRPVKPPGIAS